jgi:hypothetical protein
MEGLILSEDTAAMNTSVGIQTPERLEAVGQVVVEPELVAGFALAVVANATFPATKQ